MSALREVRFYAYVNRPYAVVRDALQASAKEIIQAATASASRRAESIAASLRVEVAGVQVGTDVTLSVESIEEKASTLIPPVTRLRLHWQAQTAPGLFPVMNGALDVYALTAEETQLDFSGHYEVPLGPVGKAVDALVGHRLAEASVQRLVEDVAEHLRKTLPST